MAAGSDSSYFKTPEIPTQTPLFPLPNQPNNKPTNYLYSHFLRKSLVVAALVLLPLFPSQTPEFINQTLFSRSWELLHLLFVGIAVSYGLFSRRNVETAKENQSQFEYNTQAYVSRILQASSFFDEEHESLSGSEDHKIPSLNDQDSFLDEQRSTNMHLLLPVRSLRSRASPIDDTLEEPDQALSRSSISRSASSVKNAHSSGSVANSENNIGSVVLPSPIPWRSRSARIVRKDELVGAATTTQNSVRLSIEDSDFSIGPTDSRPFRRAVTWSSRANSFESPSAKNLSPSPPVSPEMRVKRVEDLKKNFYKSPPPPPPPPPPPRHFVSRSPSITSSISNPTAIRDVSSSQKKKQMSRSSENDQLKGSSRNTSTEDHALPSSGKLRLDPLKSEVQSRANFEFQTLSKSVRTIRENGPDVVGGDQKDERVGIKSMPTERVSCESTIISTAKPIISKSYQEEEKKQGFAEKVIVEYEEESSSSSSDSEPDQDNNPLGSSGSTVDATTTNTAVSDEGQDLNEVDKKADEFIAKFREQIRLQRIESIKRSSRQHNIRNSATKHIN